MLAMASFNVSPRKSRLSGVLTKSSRGLLRKRRPQPLPRINEEDENIDAPIPSPRIGSAEDDSVLYNAVSSLMDVDSLRDKRPNTTNDSDISPTSLLYVVNPDPEPQLPNKAHSDLSLSLDWGRLSVSPRPSNASMRVPDQSNYQDNNAIVPAPLLLRKMFPHNLANSKLFQTITAAEAHSEGTGTITELAEENQPQSATEKALEDRLAEMEHQTAELRRMLAICEAKMTQMANELSQAKSMTSGPSANPSSSSDRYSWSTCSAQMQNQTTFMDIDICQDAKQMALLAHLNLVGMSAQRHRHRLPQVLVV